MSKEIYQLLNYSQIEIKKERLFNHVLSLMVQLPCLCAVWFVPTIPFLVPLIVLSVGLIIGIEWDYRKHLKFHDEKQQRQLQEQREPYLRQAETEVEQYLKEL